LKVGLEIDPQNESMKELFEKAKSESETIDVHDGEEKEIIDSLQSWLTENGAEFSKLCLRSSVEKKRSVHARRDIHKGECVLKIKQKEMLTFGRALRSKVGQMFEEHTQPADLELP
jgi:hypothetical protein